MALRLVLVALCTLAFGGCGGAGGGDGGGGGGGGGGSGNGGGGNGGGGNGVLPVVDWGPVPPGPRLPGEIAPPSFRPEFTVTNHGQARTETVRVSVPFPWTQVLDVHGYRVAGYDTAWHVLQRWPDGTVRVAQAQFTASFAAGQTRSFQVVRQPATLVGSFTPHPALAQALPEFGAEVRDRFGAVYRTFWQGPGEVLQETPLVRVRQLRGYHEVVGSGGIGRDFLTSTFFLTEFRDQPHVLVDWLLGNDYLGADDPAGSADPNLYPLGPVDLDYAAFLHRGADLVVPYRPQQEQIAAPAAALGGYTAHQVLADTFLGDGQMRRYRFVLHVDDPQATAAANEAARGTATERMLAPLMPLASLRSWQQACALGLLGGPVTGPADAEQRGRDEFFSWQGTNHFGTWGSHGDPKTTGQTGTPRNHPLSPELAHAVQSGEQRLLIKLEQMAWMQAARPYHLHGLRVEDEDDILLWDGIPIYLGSRDLSRESLGRRALFANDPYAAYRQRVLPGNHRAHGWQHFDHEHWTMDLVFDYYTATGDAWALQEIRQLGESLRGLFRPFRYLTKEIQPARAEGWAMQGLVQAWLATGEDRFRDFALDRLHFIIDEQRPRAHASGALTFQNTSARTGFPGTHRFYMPWQHGAVLYGYLAAWKFFGDPLFLKVCEDVSKCVEYGWVTNHPDPQLGLVENGLRYYVPVEHEGQPVPPGVFDPTVGVVWGGSPLGGSHVMLLGGLLQLADTTQDQGARQRGIVYGGLLEPVPYSDDDLWSKWHYLVPESWTR